MVINVLTDNNNRATSDVKSIISRRQAKMAEMGSVLFMYDRKGMIEVPAILDEEALLEAAIEAGVDDFTMEEVRDVDGMFGTISQKLPPYKNDLS